MEQKYLDMLKIKNEKSSIDWDKTLNEFLSKCFLKELSDPSDYISLYKEIFEILKFNNNINWYYISENQELSENFMRIFSDKLNWQNIAKFQILSEEFIREFQDKLDWYNISKYQELSENFIRELCDKVDWFYISQYLL